MISYFLVSIIATLLAMIGVGSPVCHEDQEACQQLLSFAIFGENISNATAFFRAPDFINNRQESYVMRGLPGPGAGTNVGDVSWKNNLTELTWTIKERNLTLNSTVFWSLSTMFRAPANYPPPPYGNPGQPTGPNQPTDSNTPYGPHPVAPEKIRSDVLILYHNGHETETCEPNYDGVVEYFNELGYDVMELDMPLIGCNPAPSKYGTPPPTTHWWFLPWELLGYHTMKFFIEPVAQAVHYAKAELGYKHVFLVGLSGGGWTTTLASAVLNEIDVSIPIAGSVPKWRSPLLPDMWVPDLPEGRNPDCQPGNPFDPPPVEGAGGDYEQEQTRPIYAVGDGGLGYSELYLLATKNQRRQLQILHDYDSCCFRAAGLFQNISIYNDVVAAHEEKTVKSSKSIKQADIAEKSRFRTVVTQGNFHEVNVRDKVIVAIVVERFLVCQASDPAYREECLNNLFDNLPFNQLHR